MVRWEEINGAALRYDVAGSGAPLVLLHELGGSLNSWDLVADELATSFQVIRFDMRGMGMSEKVRGVLSLDALAGDIDALLDRLAVQRPVAIAGCAVGGAVAVRFADRFPHRVSAFLGLGPITSAPAGQRDALLAHADRIERDGLRPLVDASFGVTYPAELRDEDTQRFQAARARWLGNDPGSFAAYYRMFADLDVQEQMVNLPCKALLLAASLDSRFPPSTLEPLARRMTQARFEVLRTAHLFAAQTPTPVVRAMLEFLREIRYGTDP